MESKEIIQKFFKKGKLLSPSSLKKLETMEDIEEILNAENNSMIIEINEQPKEQIKIIKILSNKPKEATTEDFIKYYTSKYEKMKKIITKRLQKDFISINKINAFRNEIYLLGIIKDIKKTDKTIIELEDMTGSIPISFKEEVNVELDDVIVVRGIGAGKIVYGKQIMYPDVPLRKPTTGKGKICLISTTSMDEAPEKDVEKLFRWLENQDIKNIFIIGQIKNKEKIEQLIERHCQGKKIFITEITEEYPNTPPMYNSKLVTPLSNPSIVEINGVKILNIGDFDIQMLKKRYLGKTKTILPEDYLALEEVPDIVNFDSVDHSIINYKAITIVSSGYLLNNFHPVVIDLETREVYPKNI